MNAASTSDRPKELVLEKGTIIEYVGGARPYIWIGTRDGHCIDWVDVRDLRAFLRGRRG